MYIYIYNVYIYNVYIYCIYIYILFPSVCWISFHLYVETIVFMMLYLMPTIAKCCCSFIVHDIPVLYR